MGQLAHLTRGIALLIGLGSVLLLPSDASAVTRSGNAERTPGGSVSAAGAKPSRVRRAPRIRRIKPRLPRVEPDQPSSFAGFRALTREAKIRVLDTAVGWVEKGRVEAFEHSDYVSSSKDRARWARIARRGIGNQTYQNVVDQVARQAQYGETRMKRPVPTELVEYRLGGETWAWKLTVTASAYRGETESWITAWFDRDGNEIDRSEGSGD